MTTDVSNLEVIMSLSLKRPKILARAGRAGAELYDRNRDLGRIVPKGVNAKVGPEVVAALKAIEDDCDRERRAGAVTYSFSKHLRVLSALIAESTRLKAC